MFNQHKRQRVGTSSGLGPLQVRENTCGSWETKDGKGLFPGLVCGPHACGLSISHRWCLRPDQEAQVRCRALCTPCPAVGLAFLSVFTHFVWVSSWLLSRVTPPVPLVILT